jgi:hypothetical protein
MLNQQISGIFIFVGYIVLLIINVYLTIKNSKKFLIIKNSQEMKYKIINNNIQVKM